MRKTFAIALSVAIVVVLVNDPGYATGDDALFNGRSMTYYGRWTYKYASAARQGAVARPKRARDDGCGTG